MRLSFISLSMTVWIIGIATAGKPSTGNGFDPALFGTMPECGSLCLHQVAKNFACDWNTTCVCTAGSLLNKLDSCFEDMCPPLEAAVSFKVHHLACDAPTRNRTPVVTGTVLSLFAVASIMITLRVLARCPWIGGPGYGVDDYTIIFCYFLSAGMVAFCFVLSARGAGQDFFELTIPKIVSFLFYFHIGQTLYVPAVFISKASMVLLYMRTWPSFGQWTMFRSICWMTLGCILTAMIIMEFISIFYCNPISTAWSLDIEARKEKCLNTATQAFGIAAISIFLDIVVLMLPISKLVELPISIRQKIALCSVFMAGLLVTAVAIVRLKYISTVGPGLLNFTYEYSYIGLWSVVEVLLSVVCVCMPAATGFLRRLCGPGIRSRSTSRPSELDEDQLVPLPSSSSGIQVELLDDKGCSLYGLAGSRALAKG